MSTTSRRFVAVAVAAIIAVVTGIAVGLVSPERTCRPAAGGKGSCTVAMFGPVPAGGGGAALLWGRLVGAGPGGGGGGRGVGRGGGQLGGAGARPPPAGRRHRA